MGSILYNNIKLQWYLLYIIKTLIPFYHVKKLLMQQVIYNTKLQYSKLFMQQILL